MNELLIKNSKRPLNESETHYELKQIAKYILKNKGYHTIGEEIFVGQSNYLKDFNQFKPKSIYKNTIDVIGLLTKGTFYHSKPYGSKNNYFKEPVFKSIGIESKASLEDFKNGFCCRPEKVYIIAPKGVIPIELIPLKIGLIQVDLENYKITKGGKRGLFEFEGIEETVKPKIRIDDRFIESTKPLDNPYYQHWCKEMLRNIAYRQSNMDIYKFNQIVIDKLYEGNMDDKNEEEFY